MALTNAGKQARWRARRNELARTNPEVIERELLQAAERCSRLSAEERDTLADRLQDAAMRHFHSMHKLNEMAKKVRPGGR
jgi:hypothetical protein